MYTTVSEKGAMHSAAKISIANKRSALAIPDMAINVPQELIRPIFGLDNLCTKQAPMFIQKKHKRAAPPTLSCRWCGKRQLTKYLYKLRDGPIDWWFCDDTHALEWLDYRHKTPRINAMLKLVPPARDLNGKSIDEWVRDELSQRM